MADLYVCAGCPQTELDRLRSALQAAELVHYLTKFREFAETYHAYPVGTDDIQAHSDVTSYCLVFYFSRGTGKDARVFKVAVSEQLIKANSMRGPGAVMGAIVDAIRKAVSPWPLECDARWFRARALRWFRR